MTEALQEIRTLARQFATEQLRPNVERWDHERAMDRDIVAQLAELGFFGMLIPEVHGGMEFDAPTYVAALEELAWGEASVALLVARSSIVADLLLRHGTDEQRRKWLERLAAGAVVACSATTVSGDDGEDALRAVRDGDGWILNGTRSFVMGGGTADLVLLAASKSADGKEPALLLVPTDCAGYDVLDREATMGFRALDVSRVRLDGVRLEAGAAIDSAQATAREGTDLGRLSMAAIALGIAQAALDHATAYAAMREQFGQKLRAFEGIQFKLADMATRVHVTRAVVTAAASAPTAMSTAIAKLFASEAAMWVTTQAVQVFGGYGYMRDYPVEKLMRDAKGTEILEGSNEQLRAIIARELYHGTVES
ncbi:MAG: acyl-CoA dehydrogenase family protein [Longimicrobiales bacterium]